MFGAAHFFFFLTKDVIALSTFAFGYMSTTWQVNLSEVTQVSMSGHLTTTVFNIESKSLGTLPGMTKCRRIQCSGCLNHCEHHKHFSHLFSHFLNKTPDYLGVSVIPKIHSDCWWNQTLAWNVSKLHSMRLVKVFQENITAKWDKSTKRQGRQKKT